MSLPRLPIELLDDILSFLEPAKDGATLCSCALVSRDWFLSASACIWRDCEWTVSEYVTNHRSLLRPQKLMRDYRECIQKLKIIPDEEGEPAGRLPSLARFLKSCPSMRYLCVDVVCLTDDDLWSLTTSCPQLRVLSLKFGTVESGYALSDEGLMAIAKNCGKLKDLRLTLGECVLSDRGLKELGDRLAGKMRGFGLECVPREFRFATGMTIGNVGGMEIREGDGKRRLEGLKYVLQQNPQMKVVSFGWGEPMDDFLEFASEHLRSLERLKLTGTVESPVALGRMLNANKDTLTALSLVDILCPLPLTGIFQPLLHLTPPRLQVLELNGMAHVYDILLLLPRFPLQHLKIYASRQSASISHINSDQRIAGVIKACPDLRSISIPIYGDLPILAMAGCHRLETVEIKDGRHVTDSSMIHLIRRCPNITRLELGSATLLTDATWSLLAQLPLHTLGLPFGLTNQTHRTLTAITRCRTLRVLRNLPITVGRQALMDCIPAMKLKWLGVWVDGRLPARERLSKEEEQIITKGGCRMLQYS